MKHRRRRRRGKGGTKGLQVIQADRPAFQPADQRDLVRGDLADVIAQQRKEQIIQFAKRRQIKADRRLPTRIQITIRQGRAACQGDQNIQIIRVFQCTRAQHRIGEDHSVRFPPGDGLPSLRRRLQKVWRTGIGGLGPHLDIGIRQRVRRLAKGRRNALSAPVPPVDADRVHCRRHPHPCPQIAQLPGKLQTSRALVEDAIQMRHVHINQFGCALDPRGLQHDPHRDPRGFAKLTRQKTVVDPVQNKVRRVRFRQDIGLRPGDKGIRRLDPIPFDPRKAGVRQRRKPGLIQLQHRNPALEQLRRDQHAQRQDGFLVLKHQRRGRMAVQQKFKDHQTARTGPPPAGDAQDLSGHRLPAQRMMHVDDPPCRGIHPTHEPEAGVGMQDRAARLT